MNNWLKSYINQLLKSLKKETYIHHLNSSSNMQLISKFPKGIRFLLCVVDIFSKYAWIIPLKDKKGVTIVNAFQSTLNNTKRKRNKIWLDKRNKFTIDQ